MRTILFYFCIFRKWREKLEPRMNVFALFLTTCLLQASVGLSKYFLRDLSCYLFKVPFNRKTWGLRPKSRMILIEIKKEVHYLKKNSQTPQEKNRENLNRSNVYGVWANNLVLFSWTGLYHILDGFGFYEHRRSGSSIFIKLI